MTQLSEDSLVKRFGKKATVIVDICGDKDNAASRDKEKAQTAHRDAKDDIVRDILAHQREASMDR